MEEQANLEINKETLDKTTQNEQVMENQVPEIPETTMEGSETPKSKEYSQKRKRKQKTYEKREVYDREAKNIKRFIGKSIYITRTLSNEGETLEDIAIGGDGKFWDYVIDCKEADYIVVPGDLETLNTKILYGLVNDKRIISGEKIMDLISKEKKIGNVAEMKGVKKIRDTLLSYEHDSYNDYLFFAEHTLDEPMFFKDIIRPILTNGSHWKNMTKSKHDLLLLYEKNKQELQDIISGFTNDSKNTYLIIFDGLLIETKTTYEKIKGLAKLLGKKPVLISERKDVIFYEEMNCVDFYKFLASGKDFSKLFDEHKRREERKKKIDDPF